jgi:hypothetical protein
MSHDLRRAALTLASRGLAVFPLKARDKAPASKHGFKDATVEEITIKAWWDGWPEQNIGVATGERSGVFVVDVDDDKGGESSLAKLCERHGPLPATVESVTGKGRHVWFRYPAGLQIGSTAGRLGPGLDTRGNDGYVVVPPSVHPNGRQYAWSVDCADEFADAPDWLIEILEGHPKANGNGHGSADTAAGLIERLSPDVRALIASEREKGQRSGHSYAVMCRLFEAGLSDFQVLAVADGAPFARKFWERGDLLAEIARARGRWQRANGRTARSAGPDWRTVIFTAADLETRDFPDVSWIVPGLIPEGLTLLAGKPKIGKSWLALDLALGVAGDAHVMGGIRPAVGDVLYCALEDNQRRLKRRIRKLLGKDWSGRLALATSWRRLDQGGIDDLRAWCASVEAARLIILDTLAGVRPVKTSNGYTEDYDALADLHRLANELGIAIVVLHHTRKMDAEDPFDTVSGTLGLTGCADTTMVLNRTGQGTTLYGRGRDIEEFERAMEFGRETCRWRMLGNADEVRRSDTRKAVLATLAENTEAMTPKEIATATGKSEGLINTTLFRMVRDGEVSKEKRGEYRLKAEAVSA